MTLCRRESGHALLLALFALVVLMVSLSLLVGGLQQGLAEQRREVERVRLDLLLDAAVAETLGRLAQDPDLDGVSPYELGHGRIWSRVRAIDGGVEIDAGASLGQRQTSAVVRARLGPGDPRVVSWRRGG